MTGPAWFALAVVGASVAAVAVALLWSSGQPLSEQERAARWCEDGFLDHMGGVCRHAATTRADEHAAATAVEGVERRTTTQAFADVDLQLALVGDLLEVWPGDAWALQRRDNLLDERSALMRAAAAHLRARVVRQAAPL